MALYVGVSVALAVCAAAALLLLRALRRTRRRRELYAITRTGKHLFMHIA